MIAVACWPLPVQSLYYGLLAASVPFRIGCREVDIHVCQGCRRLREVQPEARHLTHGMHAFK